MGPESLSGSEPPFLRREGSRVKSASGPLVVGFKSDDSRCESLWGLSTSSNASQVLDIKVFKALSKYLACRALMDSTKQYGVHLKSP